MTVQTVQLQGLLGDALDANRRGRLSHFIVDEHSPAIALFAPELRAQNREGDWYGEHAGKWLVAAAKAAARSGDAALTASVRRVADYLASVQEPDGYLGTYAPDRRFMCPQLPKPLSWDGAPSVRTWDIWTHAYLMLGFIEAHRQFGDVRWLDAARRIGDLCWETLDARGFDIVELGNHFGMSATVLMDPAVELFFVTGNDRYLQLAEKVLAQADAHAPLALLTRALAGADAAEIGTGKAYQLAWNLVGLAKLHRATGKLPYREAVEKVWRSIRDNHLSLGGGPWGGVAHRSREVFNAPGTFSPHGYVETCSSLAWIQLNRELLRISGESRYADEIERTAYNDLLGAQAPNGEDWCYYVFPNGKRVHTTYWRCCKSSGAMAIEELPAIAYSVAADGALTVDLYGPGAATVELRQAGRVVLRQETNYPADGNIAISVEPERAAEFALRLRIPQWAANATLQINGTPSEEAIEAGTYVTLTRRWQAGDRIALDLPMQPRLQRAMNRNVQISRAPDGSAVEQEVLRFDYVALTRGPLAYATGLVDGYKLDETLPPSPLDIESMPASDADGIPALSLVSPKRPALTFEPYYRAGGRRDGAWRLTWLSLAPPSDDA
jgi:DUF1680 family protein